jgi:glycosyltransferase involved in cell wall biosynthesis
MSDLTVSVIVPVFNGEAFVRESLDSILGQTYPPSEVIVMDDGSTDSTPEIVASYGEQVRYVRQPRTRGIYGNANDGIALAGGDLIGVFHADDVYLPRMLEREVRWLTAHPEAGAVFCADVFVDADGREFGKLAIPEEVSGARVLDHGAVLNALLTHTNTFLRCPTALVRAHVYRELGGYRDTRFKNTSDVDMWLRIASRYPIGIVDEHLVRYRRGHGSSSERYHRVRTDPFRYFEIVDEHLRSGAADVATDAALRAHEAHRAVDAVLRAVNHYILGDVAAARAVLDQVRLRTLARSSRIDRGRMLVLTTALRLLVRLPRVGAVGRAFARHWHGTPDPAGTA